MTTNVRGGRDHEDGKGWEVRSMSIQALKQSLPELSDQAFERTYRQFFLKALAPVLGYEVSRSSRGLGQGEGWDEILDCFEAERQRRYGWRQSPSWRKAKTLKPSSEHPNFRRTTEANSGN
jgi:hypothetical protein